MAEKKVHWTQTPEGRERLRASTTASAAKRLATMRQNKKKAAKLRVGSGAISPAARKKLSASMKARWAEARALKNGAAPAAETNGHVGRAELVTYAGNSKKLMAAAVRRLAVDGARLRLAAVERERELLLMFIKSEVQ